MATKQLSQKRVTADDLAKRIQKLNIAQAKHTALLIWVAKKLESMKPLSARLKRKIKLLQQPSRKSRAALKR